jgi:hypothetical protein
MFLFYDAYTVGEAKKVRPDLFQDVPSNIGDDYVVYVDNLENPSSIVGYRSGTNLADVKWYKADGTQVSDPKSISQQLNPLLKDPDAKMTPDAFKDYEPQITPMPRISFSFPISDVALFFAHYDILSKRPYDAVRLNMIQYYYITTQGQNVINNPNLKPEKTVDYEIGFQQKLNDVSALKISGFYREMNNMAQVQYVYGAYPVDSSAEYACFTLHTETQIGSINAASHKDGYEAVVQVYVKKDLLRKVLWDHTKYEAETGLTPDVTIDSLLNYWIGA